MTRGLIGAQIAVLLGLLALVLLIALSDVDGYDFKFLQISGANLGHLPSGAPGAIASSLVWGCCMALVAVALSFLYVGVCYHGATEVLIVIGIVALLLSSPATRAAALAILLGHLRPASSAHLRGLVGLVAAMLSALATIMPYMMAAITLSVRQKLPAYLDVTRNFGGTLAFTLRHLMLPMSRPALVAAFLLGLPLAVFDPYSLRIAGGQVVPSIGALLVDLESVSDWPGIAAVCLLSVALLMPVFVTALPFTRGRS